MSRKEPKFFTLIFYENEQEVTTKVPAKKGKSLGDTVSQAFECNNWSTDTHSLFLEHSNTPLSFQSESIHFGGNVLYVQENEKVQVDQRVYSLMRNEPSPASSRKSFGLQERRFFDTLNKFDLIAGTGDVVDGSVANGDGYLGDEFELEHAWNDVIKEEVEMSPRQRVQQQAIWELFTTEVGFIRDVKVIIEVFQKCFRHLKKSGYLTEVKEADIFANIGEICDVNVEFWRSLRRVVEEARETQQTISPHQLVPAFRNFEILFQPYIEFCNADTSNINLPEYPWPTSDFVRHYVTWCDNHESCKRISLSGFLIKPLQRVTKYSLLLKAILNKTDDEHERQIAEELRTRVETFVSKINNAIHLRQEQEKLENVLHRLADYSPPIEPINDESERLIKEYCTFDLKGAIPGLSPDEKRFILKEGPMKIFVERNSKKEAYVFLFTDVLIVTKLKRNIDKYRIIRQPYRLNKLVVRDMKDPGQLLFVYLNEYGVSATAFVAQVEVDELEKWKVAINNGKNNYDVIRTEFGLRDNFWDDDLPNSSVSTNKVLRRAACVRKPKKPETPPPPSDEAAVAPLLDDNDASFEPVVYEWDTALTIVMAGGFVLLNIVVGRIIGYIWQ